ncbi:MAG: S8 family serine peptidase, partial [Caldithrix sp.]|nr:S8 family serine peptidase [Caldithrix sp.]
MDIIKKLILLVYTSGLLTYAQQVPNYSHKQTYLGEPPVGMNVHYAWKYQGGKGRGIKIVDIETLWNTSHVDLTGQVSVNGGDSPNGDHGTAVMGIIVAKEDGEGITGFAPNAFIRGIQHDGSIDITDELNQAVNWLSKNGQEGDIILVEVQVDGTADEITYRNMPAEFLPTDGSPTADNRDNIKNAVEAGYIVVEVAGNGQNSLNPFKNSYIPINYTGAIMVGAKDTLNQYAAGNSNFGERIDANGWGEHITTTGGEGDLFNPEPNKRYTEEFWGTSGATPMVVGVIAILQSINEAYKGERLLPDEMRELIRGENNGNLPYGIRPDFKKLIKKLEIPHDLTVKQVNPNQDGLNTNFARLENGQWNTDYIDPEPFGHIFAENAYYRANQELIWDDQLNKYIKFHSWEALMDSYINYHSFHIEPGLNEIVAHFEKIDEATLDISFISGGDINNRNVEIKFKDPWLYDCNGTYGSKNCGFNATYHTEFAPFNIAVNSDYRGVFLNQPYTGTNPVYYSVLAPEEQTIPFHNENITWYFQNWTGSDVDFEHADQNETAVVFQQP